MGSRRNPGARCVFIASITSWFIVACMTTAAASADFLITGTSVGWVRLGATKEEISRNYLHKRVLELDLPLEGEAKSRAVQIKDGNEVLISAEVSENGKAWRITTQQPAFKTSRGVGVGVDVWQFDSRTRETKVV